MQYCTIISPGNNISVKFTSSRGDNSAINDSMVMKIAHAELYTTGNIVCNFECSTCNIVGFFSLDNNNSVKLTSSREDNSTINGSMVMKIAHAQLHMYTNIMCKFQSSTCKTRRKAADKIVPTDRQTEGQPWQFQYIPLHFVVGSIIMDF